MEKEILNKLRLYFNNPFFRLFCLTFILTISKNNYLLAILLSLCFVILMNEGFKANNYH